MIEDLRSVLATRIRRRFTCHEGDIIQRRLNQMVSKPSAHARVFVYEEEPLIAQLMADIFTYEGYEVVTASNVQDAILRALVEKFDIAFLDAGIGSEGLEFVGNMTAMLLPDTPVILTTTYADCHLIRRVLVFGARALISKPFAPSEVIKVARDTLSRRTPGCSRLNQTN